MKVRVTYNVPNEPLLRQTPGCQGVWKECRVRLNDPTADECDVWVVLEGLERKEQAFVRSGIVIFIAFEPPATEGYLPEFLAQFDVVIAAHPDLLHPNLRNEYQGLPWHAGVDRGTRADQYAPGKPRLTIDYDQFVAMSWPTKTGVISTVVSDLESIPGRKTRIRFAQALKEELGDVLQVFGRGSRPVPDKFDAIAPFQYHLVMENSATLHYWSEKLSDAYLGFAYPIYWGCPNIDEYFPLNSLSTVDILKPTEAISQITSILQSGTAERCQLEIAAARRLVLDRYNTFEIIRRACTSVPHRAPRVVTLYPGHRFIPPSIKINHALRGLATRVPGARRLWHALRGNPR